MSVDLLNPTEISKELEERLFELKQALLKVKKRLENAPSGHLKLSRKKTHTEFYHITQRGASRGTYIAKKNRSLAAQLAQKEYDRRLLTEIPKEIRALENFLKQTDNLSHLPKIYDSLCPERCGLTIPLTLTKEQFAAQWKAVTWKGRDFQDEDKKLLTANGETVRSKSEVIIADTLHRMGIPYRYEFPLKIKKSPSETRTFYPDFLCLNLRTRQEFYWEHFGLMCTPGYANNAIGKINLYAYNGFFPGQNLIITFEAGDEKFDTHLVEKMIQTYLI